MKSDEPRMAQMLADKYIFEEWDCPDTNTGGLTLSRFRRHLRRQHELQHRRWRPRISRHGKPPSNSNRSGFAIYREGVKAGQNPILTEDSFIDGTTTHMQNFFECLKSRKQPNAPVEAGVAAARAGHIANLAYRHTGQITWPAKSLKPRLGRQWTQLGSQADPTGPAADSGPET